MYIYIYGITYFVGYKDSAIVNNKIDYNRVLLIHDSLLINTIFIQKSILGPFQQNFFFVFYILILKY